jgi:pSer/pThr/pTyr-binding forkhead associated (FHA) protein
MLQKEIATYLKGYASEHSYTVPGEAQVRFERDEAVRSGGMKITTRLEDPGDATSLSSAELQPTRVMPLADLPTAKPATRTLSARARIELQGATCYLDQDVASLGRGLDNDVVVEDARVSRHHARLQRGPRGWEIVDLASTNGTFVNGRPVRQRHIANGDTLSLGGLEMKFYLDAPKR